MSTTAAAVKAAEDKKTVEKKASPQIGGLDIQSAAERSDYIKVLVFGTPGVGKTMLAASASVVAGMGPVLLIDIEGGTKSIRNVYPEVKVVRIRDNVKPDGKLVPAWENMGRVAEELRRGVGGYRTIIVDSLTEASKICMRYVLRQAVQQDPSRDPDIPAQRDWGKSGEQMRRMVREAFRDLDCHVIFTALEQQVKDERDGRIYIKPSLPGKLADEVPGYMDEVLYMRTEANKEEVKRYLLTQPNGYITAKDRSGKLPTVVENPTMGELAKLMLD